METKPLFRQGGHRHRQLAIHHFASSVSLAVHTTGETTMDFVLPTDERASRSDLANDFVSPAARRAARGRTCPTATGRLQSVFQRGRSRPDKWASSPP